MNNTDFEIRKAIAGGKFENTIMNPLDGNLIINSNTTKTIYFDYKTLVWDKSL